MWFLPRIFAIAGTGLFLLLAAYGAWALVTDVAGPPGPTAAAEALGSLLEERTSSQPSPRHDRQNRASDGEQDEMVKLCTEHMRGMQPLMEQMMRDMMAKMMDGGMMMDDGMMGR